MERQIQGEGEIKDKKGKLAEVINSCHSNIDVLFQTSSKVFFFFPIPPTQNYSE